MLKLYGFTYTEKYLVKFIQYGTKIIVIKFVLTRFVIQGLWIAAKLRHLRLLSTFLSPKLSFSWYYVHVALCSVLKDVFYSFIWGIAGCP